MQNIVFAGHLLVVLKNVFPYYNCQMSKEINDAEIQNGPININVVDIDKIFILGEFGCGKKSRKYFIGYTNNYYSFFLVYQKSKNEWISEKCLKRIK